MRIDEYKLLSFLRDHGISFDEKGPDVSKGNINIHCPFCGEDDTGKHMGINLATGIYGCWRNKYSHKGRDVSRLLAAITSETRYSIRLQLGMSLVVDKSQIERLADELFADKSREKNKEMKADITLLSAFKPLWKNSYAAMHYTNYLKNRGFNQPTHLAFEFQLHYCIYGDWKHRIIYPVFVNKKLMSWVGRSIHRNETYLPYRDLSIEESCVAPKFCIGNYDNVKRGGDVLFIVEGFIDELKLNWYLPTKQRATCLFTNSMTEEQKYLLWEVGKKYDKVVVLLDNDAIANSFVIKSRLEPMLKNVFVGSVPNKYGDPGAVDGLFISDGGLLSNGRILQDEKKAYSANLGMHSAIMGRQTKKLDV